MIAEFEPYTNYIKSLQLSRYFDIMIRLSHFGPLIFTTQLLRRIDFLWTHCNILFGNKSWNQSN